MADESGSDNNEEQTTEVSSGQAPSENYLVHQHLQRMPTLVSRGLIYIVIAIFASAVIYAYLAEIDVVVEAQGVARTTSPEMNVTLDRSGYLKRVFVEEGDTVTKGDPLFLIRSKRTVNYKSKIQSLKEKIPLKKDLYGSKIRSRKNRLKELETKLETSLRIKKLKIDQNKSTIQSLQSDLAYWQGQKERFEDEFEKTKSLYEQQLTSIREYNRIKNQLQKARSEVDKLKSRIRIKKQRNKILQEEITQTRQDYQQKTENLTDEISNLQLEMKSELQDLRNELENTRNLIQMNNQDTGNVQFTKMDENLILASRSGIVTGIRYHNNGRFIRSGQRLCNIVPQDTRLYMEVKVLNSDIGFIEEGMAVKYKFNAFPYQDYGMREGRVKWIAPSAVETKNGMVYKIEGNLKQSFYRVDGQKYPIKPGMTASVELVTERKSIANMLFTKLQ